MYQIAICDNKKEVCSKLRKMLYCIEQSLQDYLKVEVFYSGEGLYEYLRENEDIDLIFMNLEMQGLNGVRTGTMIREKLKNEMVHIVYISSQEVCSMQVFDIRPLNCLMKPLTEGKVEKVLREGIRLSAKREKVFEYKKIKDVKKQKIKDILYFRSMGKEIEMVTTQENIIFYGALKDIYAELKEYHFYYCNRSYLVNQNQISEYTYESLLMKNEKKLTIAQRRRGTVRRFYIGIESEEN